MNQQIAEVAAQPVQGDTQGTVGEPQTGGDFDQAFGLGRLGAEQRGKRCMQIVPATFLELMCQAPADAVDKFSRPTAIIILRA